MKRVNFCVKVGRGVAGWIMRDERVGRCSFCAILSSQSILITTGCVWIVI